MKTLPSLISSGIAEFDEEFKDTFLDGPYYRNRDFMKAFLKSFATNVHNAAIESALEALPKPYLEVALDAHKLHLKQWRNMVLEESRAKLSALKKENV